MSMTQHTHWLVVAMLLSWPSVSKAAQVEANIKGDLFRWHSAQVSGGSVVPSFWDIPIGLPAAEQVIVGGVSNTQEQTVRVSLGGTTVGLPITLKGMEYRLSSNAREQAVSGGTATTKTKDTLGQVVTGRGAGNKLVTLSRVETPFTHYRPVIQPVNTQTWAQAFRKAGASNGQYRGVLPVTATYDYVRGGVRVRQTLMLSLAVVVDYTAQHLSAVNVTGEDAMTVTYQYPLLASGETTYTITATGRFTNGVWMGLMPSTHGGDFVLTSSDPDNNAEIKYNVTCITGCESNQQMVIEGKPNINNTSKRTKITAVNAPQARAQLKVNFDRVPLSEVRGGVYTGAFTLMFEASI